MPETQEVRENGRPHLLPRRDFARLAGKGVDIFSLLRHFALLE